MPALRRPPLRASALPAAESAQSRSISWPAAWCAGDKMLPAWIPKRDYVTLAHDCGPLQVRRPVTGISAQISLGQSMHVPNADCDGFAVEFGRFVDRADGAAKTKQLFDFLSAFALYLGCTWIAYGTPTIDHKVLKPVRCNSKEILNYPDEWQERCVQMGYARIAPIIEKSRMRAGPIRWIDVYSDASTTEYERRSSTRLQRLA